MCVLAVMLKSSKAKVGAQMARVLHARLVHRFVLGRKQFVYDCV